MNGLLKTNLWLPTNDFLSFCWIQDHFGHVIVTRRNDFRIFFNFDISI